MAFAHETTGTAVLYSSSLMQLEDDDQEYCTSSTDPTLTDHCRHRCHNHHQQLLADHFYEYNHHHNPAYHPHMSRIFISNSTTNYNPTYSNGADHLTYQEEEEEEEEEDDNMSSAGICMSMLSIESFDAEDEKCSDEKGGSNINNEGRGILSDPDDELQVGFCSSPATPPRRRPTKGGERRGPGGYVNSQQVKAYYGNENEADNQKLGTLLRQQEAAGKRRRRRRRRVKGEGWVGRSNFVNIGDTSNKEKKMGLDEEEEEDGDEEDDDDKMEMGSTSCGRNVISNIGSMMKSNRGDHNKGCSSSSTMTGEEISEGEGVGLVVLTRPKGGRRCLCMDLEEVKACKDLGFELEEIIAAAAAPTPTPTPTRPRLSVSSSASPAQQQLDCLNNSSGGNSPILPWRMISSPGQPFS